ncbi:hypothetical protein DPEC_G00068180 [Dallia pectoralis]|uniref:Uncharacterized protein n=1 Tax=Dallia pectoralis TaxID=75939 RepID=A0ACC2H1H4_DALPE|nr:hypothetical protein DPEC_G00068180 [Dallia pectoralis]
MISEGKEVLLVRQFLGVTKHPRLALERLKSHCKDLGLLQAECHPAGVGNLRVFCSDITGWSSNCRRLSAWLIWRTACGRVSSVQSVSRRPTPSHVLDQRATEKDAKRFLKTSLDIKLLRFKRWICITVCSLLAVIEVCGTDPIEWLRLQESLFSLLGKLRPGKVTREELSDLMRIWLRGCVVCNSSFVNTDVYKSLHRMSSMMCSVCRKRCVVKDTEAASVNGETESQGEPDMKVARLLSVE